jgi:hypothetical protein
MFGAMMLLFGIRRTYFQLPLTSPPFYIFFTLPANSILTSIHFSINLQHFYRIQCCVLMKNDKYVFPKLLAASL